MQPKRVGTPIVHFPSTSKIYSEPYGSVLIAAPWNYPLQLALKCLWQDASLRKLRGSQTINYSPATVCLIKKIITENFPPEYISVAETVMRSIRICWISRLTIFSLPVAPR